MIELNKVYNEDCIGENGMIKIKSKSIDMILCDLPYGTTQNKWDSIIDLEIMWTQYKRIIKDDGAIVLTAQTPFDKILGASNIPMLKYEWIWQKTQPTGFLNAKKMPLKAHENVLVFYKKLPVYNPILKDKPVENIRTLSNKNIGDGSSNYGSYNIGNFRDIPNDKSYPSSILKFNNPQNGLHPTEKPIDMFRYLIQTYTNSGDTVLDNCMGSGTTAIACIEENRNYIGFELDKDYFNGILKRIKQHTAQTSLFQSA